MLAYAIIAAKSTSIWPDLSYEDWATGNDAWKNVQILLGIESCESIFFASQTPGVRSFSWSKDPWCEFVWPLRKVPVVCFCVRVCVFFGDGQGWHWHGVPWFCVSRCETKRHRKIKIIGAGTGHWKLKILNYSPPWSWNGWWEHWTWNGWWEQIWVFPKIGVPPNHPF